MLNTNVPVLSLSEESFIIKCHQKNCVQIFNFIFYVFPFLMLKCEKGEILNL